MNQSYKVSIILVNWNGSQDTIDCIKSINKSDFSNYRIIVIDNGSTLENLEILKSADLQFDLFEANKNLGYTGGNNLGISKAMEQETEYVLLLNNDTFIEEDTLTKLINSANKYKDASIISPKIYFYPEKNLIWSADTKFNKLTLMGKMIGYKKPDSDIYNHSKYVDYVTGCAMMIKNELIQKIGVLDDDFFAVCEDIDYCLRAKSNGYKILYEASATVYHKEASSSGGYDSPQYTYYTTRGYFLLHNKWARNIFHLSFTQLYYLLYCAKRIISFIFKGNYKGVLAIFFAIKDSILGRYGFQEHRLLKTKSNFVNNKNEN